MIGFVLMFTGFLRGPALLFLKAIPREAYYAIAAILVAYVTYHRVHHAGYQAGVAASAKTIVAEQANVTRLDAALAKQSGAVASWQQIALAREKIAHLALEQAATADKARGALITQLEANAALRPTSGHVCPVSKVNEDALSVL